MDRHDIKFRAWDFTNSQMYFNGDDFGTTHDYEPLLYKKQGQNVEEMQYTGYNYKDTDEEMYTGDVVYIAGLGNCEIGIDKFYGIVAIQGKYETPLIDCILEGDYPVKLGDKYQNPELLK